MEAHVIRCALLVSAVASMGASYRTANFIVEAPTANMAEQIGRAAEGYRRDLAIDWLGREMPKWSQPCPITCQVADHLGAGGATSFVFEHGEVFGWRMTIQGSLVRILDSVLPHEVTHTIFATHFRRPLPRWADEGACTTVEHHSERQKQQMFLIDFLRTGRGIAFGQMFAMKEYPQDVMPLYSQGYSLARYLVAQGGKRKFLNYLSDGMSDENWARATQKHYGVNDLAALQTTWLNWVRQGSPALDATRENASLVAVAAPQPSPERPRPSDDLSASRPGPSEGEVVEAKPIQVGEDTPSVYELASTSPARFHSAATSQEQTDKSWRSPRRSPADAVRESEIVSKVGPADDFGNEPPVTSQHQATRPQPVQRPRQVILEWSKAPGNESSVAALTPGKYPGPSDN
jgi:hypothetical protein